MNKKHLLWVVGFGVVAIGGFLWWQAVYAPGIENDTSPRVVETVPDVEAAELVGFGFMQDLVKASKGEDDEAARERLYTTLSARAKTEVATDALMRDIAAFVGIEDVPEHGVSVENLEVHSATSTRLIVGLNFSGGRQLRAIGLIVEEGEWKVDMITTLETYPPEEDIVVLPENDRDDRVSQNGCYVGGCSGQICSEDPEALSTCEWREEYACYHEATCEHQVDGQCGWTQTDDLVECLASAGEELII